MDTLIQFLMVLQGTFQCPTSFPAERLFELMQGQWTGRGISTWEGNSESTRFTSETFSTRTAQGLTSKNTWITEGSGKVIRSTYQIQHDTQNPCKNGKYAYLLTVAEHQLQGTGTFDGIRFETLQPLESNYSVVTRSQFAPGKAFQLSRLVDENSNTLSTTRIEYVRSSNAP